MRAVIQISKPLRLKFVIVQNMDPEGITIKEEFPNYCRVCMGALYPESDEYKVCRIREKGCKKLIIISKLREDNLFSENDTVAGNVKLHDKCRKSYTNEVLAAAAAKRKNSTLHHPKQGTVESSLVKFDYENKCFLCCKDASEEFNKKVMKYPPRKRFMMVRIINRDNTKETLLKRCFLYEKSKWHQRVRKRIQNIDLVSLKGRYHQSCYNKFLKPNNLSGRKPGRPKSNGSLNLMGPVYGPHSSITYIKSQLDDSEFANEEDPLSIELSSTLKNYLKEDPAPEGKHENMECESDWNLFPEDDHDDGDNENACTQEIHIEIPRDQRQLESKDVTLDIFLSGGTQSTQNARQTLKNAMNTTKNMTRTTLNKTHITQNATKNMKNGSTQTDHGQLRAPRIVTEISKILAQRLFPEQPMNQKKFIEAHLNFVRTMIDVLD